MSGDWENDDLTEMIREDRLCSEYCGLCNTRHHPDHACQEEEWESLDSLD